MTEPPKKSQGQACAQTQVHVQPQTPTRLTFGADARITQSSTFVGALRSKPVGRGAFFSIHLAKPLVEPPRLGVVIAKRILKKATDRNAVKRVVREAFRHARAQLPPGAYVVRLRLAPPFDSLRQLKRALRTDADLAFGRCELRQ